MRLPDRLRTTSFRLGVGYAVFFLVSVLAIFGAVYMAARSEVAAVIRSTIAEDLERLLGAEAAKGGAALRAAVAERTMAAATDQFYLLLDAGGGVIAGNLPGELWREGWSEQKPKPKLIASSEALREASDTNYEHKVHLFSLGLVLPDGERLMIARNSYLLGEFQEIVLDALKWGSGLTALLALIGGFAVSSGPTRRVDAIAATMRTIAGGRFDQRLPVLGRGDELDRLSSDINRMLERVEALMESLKQVSDDIAHDLRTPLARLRQRLDGAARQAGDVRVLQEAVADATAEADTIIETFNALLRIAQIEAGARRSRFARLDLGQLLTQLHDIYDTVAEDAGLRFELVVADDLSVDGDRDLLQQLFANLIENALTHAATATRLTLRASRAGGTIEAELADDGLGVPDGEHARIFRRLYRQDRSRTTPGNGLGLAMAAAIADLHEARIEALGNDPGLLIRVAFPTPAD
ncbi:two-component sensor histidine kinase [Aureimonas endophytica]|uniref:histidine kinase n=1 Tax=Aureimonas endophytica TaxID=2027858 RepID=A0A916ZM99_9HYPH|nr:ATP-binding protein [Aureimonas endophytica]GGE04650.1 two-component sensor histidine kinase [Aureimonas endophytica]